MRSLNKKERMTIRFSTKEDDKIAQAAKIVSLKRGQNVRPGTLIRELAMPGIDAILEESARNGK